MVKRTTANSDLQIPEGLGVRVTSQELILNNASAFAPRTFLFASLPRFSFSIVSSMRGMLPIWCG